VRRLTILFALLIAALILPCPGGSAGWPSGKVTRAIDGDTILVLLDAGEVPVRLLGVDTPETVHPEIPVQPYGPEAFAFTRSQLCDKQVWLEFDTAAKDPYGHVLAYIWIGLPETEVVSAADVRAKMFNARLLLEGYAQVLPIAPNLKYAGIFAACQAEAREAGKGLWGLGLDMPGATEPGVVVVYVTASGTKYHRAECRFLAKSRIPLPLAEAKARGYTPCSVCKPPG